MGSFGSATALRVHGLGGELDPRSLNIISNPSATLFSHDGATAHQATIYVELLA
jgi:hypothetical protein